ncbi:hypothetical protein SAMN04488565_0924 [Leucobacter chromiiresistens]|uniref:HNH endonuclease n=1 Tax=Leucobacter chromiiresistens TaxID=1079994 RepID=A0A1H0YJZ0_9MICO|nr:hypothetical protein SAMN04488565_0924 [Leucobacter chromiiresistens]
MSPWARQSQGRNAHRAFYADYITSAKWYSRRARWALEESTRIAPALILCRGRCGNAWNVDRDDLHHCVYDRLGDEAHEDLWPMCRSCHTRLHELLDSSRSWRKLPKRQANRQALAILAGRNEPPSPRSLTVYL